MAKNCVGTYEAYKARLLKMKPNVYLHGQKVDRSNGKTGAERDLADWITGGTYVMKQCYDTANDPAYADVARQSLDLWFAEVTAAVERLLDDSPMRDLVDVPALARAVGASFVGLELYEGVDAGGAAQALDALAQLTVLIDVLDGLGPVERRLLTSRLRAAKARR